MLILTLE
jgi:integrase